MSRGWERNLLLDVVDASSQLGRVLDCHCQALGVDGIGDEVLGSRMSSLPLPAWNMLRQVKRSLEGGTVTAP